MRALTRLFDHSVSESLANLFLLIIALVWVAPLGAQTPAGAGPAETGHSGRAGENYYAAARHIEIAAEMPADVIVAGREIDIMKPVAGDILAAGWRVSLSAPANDDVRIAGQSVVVNAPVSGDLTVAGGDVVVGSQAHVAGRSWLTGRNVRVEGTLDRELRIAAANVQIAGETHMPVHVVAETLEILPGARVLGAINYKGTTPMKVADGAVVSGPVAFERIDRRDAERARAWPSASTLIFSIHLFLAGLLALVVAPRIEASVVGMLRQHPGKSVLASFALLVSTPIAAVLLIISVIGLPFGLALGALYAMALFGGLVTTAFFVGDAEARLLHFGPVLTRGQHALLLLAGVLTLALLRSVLGGVIVFLGVLFGLGALMLALYEQYARPSTTAAA